MDLSHLPIIDHHAHPLLKPEASGTVVKFQRWFSESTDPMIHAQHVPHGLFLRTGIDWLAALLGCEPTVEACLAARAKQDYVAWSQRLFKDANIATLILDYGYTAPEVYSHAEHLAMLPCKVERMLRLEVLAQDLIVQHRTFEQMLEAYVDTVSRARTTGYLTLKSIIAYRTGLDIAPVDYADAAAAFTPLKEQAQRTGKVRLASKPLCDYLVNLALQEATNQAMPFQFHTGFGDHDADLRVANPLQLRRVIEHYPKVPLVLLHAGWPFYRELAHFAAIYANVWLDLSLAIPFATTGIPPMIRDVLGMAPFSKVMFATDAFTMPEIFWLAARWGRWGLGKVLDEFVAENFLSHDQALASAAAILGENARKLYWEQTP